MEDWLDPCLDADEMRATDAWAIKKQRVPSLELMETRRPGRRRGRGRGGDHEQGGDRLRQGQQRRRRPGRSPGAARDGIPGRRPAAGAARSALRGRQGRARAPRGRAAGRPGELSAAMRRRRGCRRRDLRHGLRREPPGSSGGGDRCDQRGGCAGGGDRRRLRGERVHRRGRGDGRRRRRHCHLPRAEARPLGRAREGAHRRAARWPRSASPMERRSSPRRD